MSTPKREEILQYLAGQRPTRSQPGSGSGTTSDLTIDETLLLHSIDWEPTELVCGASVSAITPGTFWYRSGQPDRASTGYAMAVATAVKRIQEECTRHHGRGVIGVRLETEITQHSIEVVVTGTAVRPTDNRHHDVFVSDLSVRDFCLLHGSGWQPVGLAFGASFVTVPRRSVSTVMSQAGQNCELTNLTEALYEAREIGMERMQSSAIALGGRGMVDVNVEERALPTAAHVVEFRAWGTAIRLGGDSHLYMRPRMVMSLNDRVNQFQVEALGNG